MAELRMTIGALSVAAATTDANASQLINDYIAAYGGPTTGTHQQRATWFIRHLAAHVRAVGASYAATQAANAERARVETERGAVSFD